MSYRAPYPAALQRVDYVKLYFHLQLEEDCELPPLALLQLRRELLGILRDPERVDDADRVLLQALLEPRLPDDPVQLSRVQKPAPALILTPEPTLQGPIPDGSRIVLPALFVGSGIAAVAPFFRLLEQLAGQGLYRGCGRFLLKELGSEDASGVRAMLSSRDEPGDPAAAPVSDLAWWLERQVELPDPLAFEVISPLRLMHQGRPLFKAAFSDIFPFLLRRVSTLLSAYGGIELHGEAADMIDQAAQIAVLSNQLRWHDWRTLKGTRRHQVLGGLTGTLILSGPALAELQWLIRLGSLFNVGKGAPYGAGQFRLRAVR